MPYLRLVCAVLLWVPCAVPAGAEPDWPPDGVARAGDRFLTEAELARTAVDALRADLRTEGTAARALLGRLVAERAVRSLFQARGFTLDPGVAEARWAAADAASRRETGFGLAERLERQGHDVETARRAVVTQVMRERLAEVGLDPDDVPVRLVEGAPDGLLAEVGGEPLYEEAFGAAALATLGRARIDDLLDRLLRTALIEELCGDLLDGAELERELRHVAAMAARERAFDSEEVWKTVWVHGGTTSSGATTADDVRRSAHDRALLTLVRHIRERITASDVASAFALDSETIYGPRVVAWVLEVPFSQGGDVFGPSTGRSRGDALALARGVRLGAGDTTFERAAAQAAEGAPDIVFRRRSLYPTDTGRLLFEHASALANGEVGLPIETLAEVHVVQRESAHPPYLLEEVEDVVRERLARSSARRWLESQLSDPDRVARRWPIPAGS